MPNRIDSKGHIQHTEEARPYELTTIHKSLGDDLSHLRTELPLEVAISTDPVDSSYVVSVDAPILIKDQ